MGHRSSQTNCIVLIIPLRWLSAQQEALCLSLREEAGRCWTDMLNAQPDDVYLVGETFPAPPDWKRVPHGKRMITQALRIQYSMRKKLSASWNWNDLAWQPSQISVEIIDPSAAAQKGLE